MTTLQVNGTYNFETIAPSVLGAEFKNAKVLSVMTYTSAAREADIPALHYNVLPFLPPGTPTDFTRYTYVELVSETNAKTILALEWIKQSSITQVSQRVITARINITNSVDITRIRNILIQNGFQGVTIEE